MPVGRRKSEQPARVRLRLQQHGALFHGLLLLMMTVAAGDQYSGSGGSAAVEFSGSAAWSGDGGSGSGGKRFIFTVNMI